MVKLSVRRCRVNICGRSVFFFFYKNLIPLIQENWSCTVCLTCIRNQCLTVCYFLRGGNPFATVKLRPTVTNDRSAPKIWSWYPGLLTFSSSPQTQPNTTTAAVWIQTFLLQRTTLDMTFRPWWIWTRCHGGLIAHRQGTPFMYVHYKSQYSHTLFKIIQIFMLPYTVCPGQWERTALDRFYYRVNMVIVLTWSVDDCF